MQQITLDFPNAKHYYEDDFIVASINQYAYDLICSWPEIWGVAPYSNTVLLCGPEMSGKTHLAHIWQQKVGACFLAPDSDLTNGVLEQYPAFIIEDINNKAWDERSLLHMFNAIYEAKKSLLLTSTIPPAEIDIKLKDLISRLNSVFAVVIDLPDEEFIKIILLKNFSERSLKVPAEVINYLSKRVARNFTDIFRIVEEIDKISLIEKRNITIPLLRNLFS